MKILQIINGYWQSDLFKKLIVGLNSLKIKNIVYIPTKFGMKIDNIEEDDIIISECFNNIDRLFFYSKQKKIVNDIKKSVDLSKIDIIHAHTLFSGGYAAYSLKKNLGIPYIVAVRNTDKNIFFKYMIHLRKSGVEIMKNAQKIIFLSPQYKTFIISKYVPKVLQAEILSKSIVIPNGIDDLFLKNRVKEKKINKEDIKIIYVGEINTNKNLETTIEAIKILIKKGFNISFCVVGSILEDKYKKLIENTNFVEYHERCPKEQVLSYLKSSDIFVMPSHTETFGLVYAEAMSQGLPVLYTKGEGFDGQFEDGIVGYPVDNNSSQDVAEKIELVINNFEEISTNCANLAYKFDWKSIAKKYEEIYKDFIRRTN